MKTPHPNKEKYQLKPCPEYQKEKGEEGVKPSYAEWKTNLPKSGEPHEEIVNNMTYHWCPNHCKARIWATHKPANCTMKGKKPAVENKFTKK